MTDTSLHTMKGLKARHRAEKRFRWYGIIAISISLAFLALMVVSITARGAGALLQTRIGLDIEFNDQTNDASAIKLIRNALRKEFPQARTRGELRQLYSLISSGSSLQLEKRLQRNRPASGVVKHFWLTASDDVDLFAKKNVKERKSGNQRLSDQQISWVSSLQENGQLKRKFNVSFFSNGDSREPEMAGIIGALVGSMLSLLVCFVVSFPIGVLAAVYLQEYAKKGWFSNLIEVNINNLAAVPSIVYGLLGLSIFLNVLNMPRSTPLVGGLVLALMTLPTIIIASRAALRSIPPSIREAATGIGASKTRTTFDHVIPLAMPGMLTGAIIGMARALGETAPLLMIGMVAFVVDIPGSITDAATSLPVQIFLWADSPERAFVERTSAAIIVLLIFLILMNLVAIVLRRRLERRW